MAPSVFVSNKINEYVVPVRYRKGPSRHHVEKMLCESAGAFLIGVASFDVGLLSSVWPAAHKAISACDK